MGRLRGGERGRRGRGVRRRRGRGRKSKKRRGRERGRRRRGRGRKSEMRRGGRRRCWVQIGDNSSVGRLDNWEWRKSIYIISSSISITSSILRGGRGRLSARLQIEFPSFIVKRRWLYSFQFLFFSPFFFLFFSPLSFLSFFPFPFPFPFFSFSNSHFNNISSCGRS